MKNPKIKYDCEPLILLLGHTGSINVAKWDLIYDKNNKFAKSKVRCFTASSDKTIRVWDIEKEITTHVLNT